MEQRKRVLIVSIEIKKKQKEQRSSTVRLSNISVGECCREQLKGPNPTRLILRISENMFLFFCSNTGKIELFTLAELNRTVWVKKVKLKMLLEYEEEEGEEENV